VFARQKFILLPENKTIETCGIEYVGE